MLTSKQIEEIKEHLNKAQNPIFFFDNDSDGLCSFLLLRKYIGRGKGVAAKSFPDLSEGYVRKIYELNPDYIFVLDKPKISKGFIKKVLEINLSIVWIDHHGIGEQNSDIDKRIFYYNPLLVKNKNIKSSSEPVTYWSYKIANRKEDLWLAFCGCIGDGFMPDFYKEFVKKYPELIKDPENIKTSFQCLYETEIGKIIQIMSFALKDRTSNVVKMLRFLINAKSPHDILEETSRTYSMLQRFNQVYKKYSKLLEKARRIARTSKKLVFFKYGGELSLSADLANELFYRFPGKIIVVAYIKGMKANVSLRASCDIRKLTLKAIEGIENATGGGHEHATGATVPTNSLQKFRENLLKAIPSQ